MKFITKLKVTIDRIDQAFELGDLTILIGRPNSGKTRILRKILQNVNSLKKSFESRPDWRNRMTQSTQIGIDLEYNPELIKKWDPSPKLVESARPISEQITPMAGAMSQINESAKKMDKKIKEFGVDRVTEYDGTRALTHQGSGIQNMAHLTHQIGQEHDFVLIDEPENNQFPDGKLQILKTIISLLDKKQIIVATHDPTIINPYLIKKLIGENQDVIVYSFNGNSFSKINFVNEEDPETHIGYLRQTFSTKPVHLIVEGKTEVYAFQALLQKYCIEEKVNHYPKILNKISVSHLEGNGWEVNLSHIPDPEYYSVLMLLDGEHSQKVSGYKFEENFEIINDIDNIKKEKINLRCLNLRDIEEIFDGIFKNKKADDLRKGKPWVLAEEILNCQDRITDILKKDDKTREIYKIIQWAVRETIKR